MTKLLTWKALHDALKEYPDDEVVVYVSPDDDYEAGTAANILAVCPTGIQQGECPVVALLDDRHYFGLRVVDIGGGPVIDVWEFEPLVVPSGGLAD